MRSAAWIMLVLSGLLLAACGSRETQPARTGSAVERTSPVRAAEINTRLGVGYLERGDVQLAMEKLLKAVEQDPSHAPAHLALGMIYERIGDSRRAVEHVQRAVRLAPGDGAAHNSLATLYCRFGRFKDADREFQLALEDPFYRTPDLVLANAGACAKRAGDMESAERYLRSALDIDPRSPVALYHLADLSYQQGDAFRARAFIQRLESIVEPDAGTLMLAWRVETALGSVQDAERYAGLLRARFPDSDEAQALRLAQLNND